MASPSFMHEYNAFVGAAAEIEITKLSFRPRIVRFHGASALWGYKTDQMEGDAYFSNSGVDAGVTITDNGFTIANGADVNVDGVLTYYEAVA